MYTYNFNAYSCHVPSYLCADTKKKKKKTLKPMKERISTNRIGVKKALKKLKAVEKKPKKTVVRNVHC